MPTDSIPVLFCYPWYGLLMTCPNIFYGNQVILWGYYFLIQLPILWFQFWNFFLCFVQFLHKNKPYVHASLSQKTTWLKSYSCLRKMYVNEQQNMGKTYSETRKILQIYRIPQEISSKMTNNEKIPNYKTLIKKIFVIGVKLNLKSKLCNFVIWTANSLGASSLPSATPSAQLPVHLFSVEFDLDTRFVAAASHSLVD